jgi:hypothetical protein
VTLLEQETTLDDQDAVDKMVQTIQNRGYYPYIIDPDEVAAIYFGFSAYRRKQGVDIDKVYKEIPVE